MNKPLNDKAVEKEIAKRIADSKACNPKLSERWPR